MKAPSLVTRYEVEELSKGKAWRPPTDWGEPVRFDTKGEAKAEVARRTAGWATAPAFRVVEVSGVLRLTELDLEEFVTPLVARFWRLCFPGREKGDRLRVFFDKKRHDVLGNWATLSPWEGRALCFAPEVEVPRLWKRFPFARPRTVEAVLRLLTLHELAHYAYGHNGLSASLAHEGPREDLAAKIAAWEAEADRLAALWWRKGLTPDTVTAAAAKAARKAS